jgi:hypothetical protein
VLREFCHEKSAPQKLISAPRLQSYENKFVEEQPSVGTTIIKQAAGWASLMFPQRSK